MIGMVAFPALIRLQLVLPTNMDAFVGIQVGQCRGAGS